MIEAMRAAGGIRLAVVGLLLAGCGETTRKSTRPPPRVQTTAPPSMAQRPGAPRITRFGAFSREQLIEDARQLADILESTHPDPYINGGGRIAFHRRLHRLLNAIPEEGMTRDEFYRLLRPFVAGVGDAHTILMGGYRRDRRQPGGVPLRFAVVESSLVVTSVPRAAQQDLLGARLVSVQDVPLAELLQRQKQLVGIDNQYHGLQRLARESLRYKAYLQDLVPEWKNTAHVRVELRSRNGATLARRLAQPGLFASWSTRSSRVALPVPDASGFLYAFLKAPGLEREIAYLRFTHMTGYREHVEGRDAGARGLSRVPSATATFRSLVGDMKARGTEVLIVDVRGNGGGNSLIVDILIYFLYGKDSLREISGFGTGESGVFRYSRLYFAARPRQSLDSINARRVVPLVEGDYEFGASFQDGRPVARLLRPLTEPPGFRELRASPTFGPEFASGVYSGYWRPKRVMVLCDAGTASAGFSVVVALHRLGGMLVGTPSAQAPNSFGSATGWRLNHTGIEGYVPVIAAVHFPEEPAKARVLPVDYPLTYERLASYDFDPNAEYLYALELLSRGHDWTPAMTRP